MGCMWNLHNLCSEVKPISFGGLNLPTTHLASIYRMNALRILNFIFRATDF